MSCYFFDSFFDKLRSFKNVAIIVISNGRITNVMFGIMEKKKTRSIALRNIDAITPTIKRTEFYAVRVTMFPVSRFFFFSVIFRSF